MGKRETCWLFSPCSSTLQIQIGCVYTGSTDAGKHHKPAEPIHIVGVERPLRTGWEQQKLHHDSKIVLGKLNLILGCGNKSDCGVAAACLDEDITAALLRYSVFIVRKLLIT